MRPHEIEFTQTLSAIAQQWVDESAPCNYDINFAGQSLEFFFVNEVDRFKQAYFISYEGQYTRDPNDVITYLLSN